ncbi:MAG: GlxA family transcriptional regulator [Hyphomicrobiaceae bacterium]
MTASRDQPLTELFRVGIAVIPRFNMMALTGVLEPMRVANYLSTTPLFAWSLVSEAGGRVVASNGLDVATMAAADDKQRLDLAIGCGSWGAEHDNSRSLHRWLRQARRQGARLGAIDLGIYLLARAGLLQGHRVTAHHSWSSGFAETFPDVEVVDSLYTIEDGLITMAGGTTGIDVMLRLVAERHGQQLAAEVADQILHHPIREPALPQRRTLGGLKPEVHPVVRAAIELMQARIAEPLSMPEIAAEVGTSQRQLERLFGQSMGCSAVRLNLLLRLQNARVLLNSTRLSIREVSAASGFNSLSYFSQVFTRTFGKRPSAYRHSWPSGDPAPAWRGTVFDYLERAKSEMGRRANLDWIEPRPAQVSPAKRSPRRRKVG